MYGIVNTHCAVFLYALTIYTQVSLIFLVIIPPFVWILTHTEMYSTCTCTCN